MNVIIAFVGLIIYCILVILEARTKKKVEFETKRN